MQTRSSWRLMLVLSAVLFSGITAQAQNRNLTAVVLVNSSNTTGYNTNSTTPGQFQRYAERYLQHLQIPYDIFDVAINPPPSDLNSRQLIIGGHPGLQLSSLWQSAIITA